MRKILAALAFLTLGLAQELVVLTHSSFSLDKALIARFRRRRGSGSASSREATRGRP